MSPAKDSRAAWKRCAPLRAQGRLKHSLAEYEQRLAREIAIIQQMKFSGYFLIVWDFIRYAREHDIPVGPGRGSAAGSLVSYALGITDIDPLQHELLFERFLNPERISLPDIDIDFCMNRRGEVINYVTAEVRPRKCRADHHLRHHGGQGGDQRRRPRHGHALRRRRPHRQDGPDHAEHQARRGDPRNRPALQQAYDSEPQVRELLDTAKKLEGMVRNAGVHAAGVVISPRPLTELVPLHKTKNDEIVTAFDMVAIEKLGLLKMDFLGLTTLTILDDAVKLIAQTRGEQIDLEGLPLDDQRNLRKGLPQRAHLRRVPV